MAKSARASGIKKNKAALKKRIFGPAETARNERLSAKLLELAQAPKPPKQEMEVENEEKKPVNAAKGDDTADVETAMDVEGNTTLKIPKSKREIARIRTERVQKRGRQRPRNQVTFPTRRKVQKGSRRK